MKMTPDYIESLVQEETYSRPGGGTLTICVLTLTGSCQVTGESNVIDAATFDAALGQKYAREKAVSKIWELEGFHLKRSGATLLIRAARAAHASIAPGWASLPGGEQHRWLELAQMALQMQPDDDIPEAITLSTDTPAAAARFCVVTRAVFGI